MAGMKYSVGTRFNFSVAAGVSEVIKIRVGKAGQLDGLDVSGAAFTFYYVAPTGPMRLPIEHGAELGVLNLSVPMLEPGEFSYSLEFTDSLGQNGVLLYGVLTALSQNRVAELVDNARAAEQRVLEVSAGSLHDGPLELRWAASSVAARFAEDCAAAAKDLEDVKDVVKEFRVFIAGWQDNMEKFLVMNPETGTIWVNGYDTGQPYKGRDGQAPRVNAFGYWEVFENGQWVTLPYKAEGKDGIDGTQVRRALLGSRAELPSGEERGVMYYTPKESGTGYDMWCWLDNAGWVCFGGDPYGVATESSLGLVMLGTDHPVESGAPVGVNERKQAMVPLASTTVPGAMKPSSDEVSDVGGGTHFSASGSLLCDIATASSFGGVKLSTNTVLTAGGIVGANADGQLLVRLATPDFAGAVRPGTYYSQLLGIPYLVSVGVDELGRLAICTLKGGALQCRTNTRWLEFKNGAMAWIDDDAFPVDGAHYLGLNTSAQFGQDESDGLYLKAATQDLLAGVKLASGVDDTRVGVVLTLAQVKEFFALKTEAVKPEDAVLKSEPWLKGVVLTEEEYNALGDNVVRDLNYVIV